MLTQIFEILIIHKPSLGPRDPTQNLGLIGSAVLKIIGHKQAKFIYRYRKRD